MCRSGLSAGVVVCLLTCMPTLALAIPAFPGAEGYGGTAVGGRGGDVYHVTSLADTSTPGTLRYGISNAPTGGRTILFDVSGTIALSSQLGVSKSNITIAGQTAPEQGICFKNYKFKVSGSNNIIRHVRSRLGIDASAEDDSIELTGGSNNIADHCSASWSVDETFSASSSFVSATIQYAYIAESLNNSIHSKGIHGYGSLFRINNNGWLTVHHSLYADHNSRNPRPGTYNNSKLVLDFRNNVIYNWASQAGYSGNDGNEYVDMNYVGNYLVAGPSTSSSKRTNAFDGGSTLTRIYQSGNKIDGDLDGTFDGTNTGWSMFSGSYTQSPGGTAFATPAVYTQTADEALQTVLGQAGAFNWNRDAIDANVTAQVLSAGTSGRIYDTVAQAGGYPTYPGGTYTLSYDTDQDGMPNTWETAYGLNPSAADNNGDFDSDGYTNLEEYLNWIAPIPAPKAIVWTGGTAGRYELIGNWDIPWQPSRYDAVEINTGKATVGYLGQEAGTMYVAKASGAAELAITAGSLAVDKGLYVGNASSARGTLNITGGTVKAGGQISLAASSSSTGELKIAKGAYVQAQGLTISSGSGRVAKVGLELDSAGAGLIHATGSSTLAGVLDVQTLSDYRPREGDAFTIIDSSDPNATYSGSFADVTSNITRGLQAGLDPFGGTAGGGDYQIVFQGLTYGDASGDHTVDSGDLSLMTGAWGQGSGWAWGNADFTGDGAVDSGDLSLLTGSWGWTLPSPAPGQSIPEPASMLLLATGFAATRLFRTRSPRSRSR